MRLNGATFVFDRAHGPRFSRLLLISLLGPLGCGFHSDLDALGRLRAEIHTHIGTDSAITVRTSEGATTVTVRLAQFPVTDSKQVQAQVEALAKAEFPNTNYVMVAGPQ